jgi:hypothetical protein
MGRLLIVSIAAMTSFMTMVQLIALTLTLPTSTAPQAKIASEKTAVVATKSDTKKTGKVATQRSARYHTRRVSSHSTQIIKASHQPR